MVTNVIGKKAIAIVEKILSRVPLVWNIYYSSKQLIESATSIGKTGWQVKKGRLVGMPDSDIRLKIDNNY